ncbi:amidohydrolase family protein [Agromyces sp. NPDC058064]|uniref:amidohydrolase family protein n=1 Tax=Agromyces sp. NPDC058064 TaxID=3346322 RepID=UPI0036D7E0FA
MTDRIDAHQHVWDLDVRPQGWTEDLPVLNRTFTSEELTPQLAAAGVDGTVLVETINVGPETSELLALGETHPHVRGVVGWVDLSARDVVDRIAELRESPGGERLVGVRHQVQGEPDARWLTRPAVLNGLRAVAEAGLVFDLLVLPHQLEAAIESVRRIPDGRFVLDHLGKPSIASAAMEPWASSVGELAAGENVACKLSGLVTEAAPNWKLEDLEPYVQHALSVFGPERIMAGSDWPVCLLRGEYAEVWDTNERLVAGLSVRERDQVLGGTATDWYRLAGMPRLAPDRAERRED